MKPFGVFLFHCALCGLRQPGFDVCYLCGVRLADGWAYFQRRRPPPRPRVCRACKRDSPTWETCYLCGAKMPDRAREEFLQRERVKDWEAPPPARLGNSFGLAIDPLGWIYSTPFGLLGSILAGIRAREGLDTWGVF